MGYIGLRLYVLLCDVFGKNYGTYYGIYRFKFLDIFVKLCELFRMTLG